MVSDEELFQALGEVLQEDLAGPTINHRMRTPSCPTIPMLADAAEYGLGPRLALHAARCGFCRLTIRAMWSALDELGNDWAIADRTARAVRSEDAVTADVQRCASALLLACEQLPRMKVPVDLRRHVADIAEVLADSLDEHDSSTADNLRRIAYAMLHTGPAPAAVRSREPFAERMTAFILQLAAKIESEGCPCYARTLYLSIGERARAGRCALQAWGEKEVKGHLDSAIVALATVRLELDGDESAVQADAQLARLAASASDVGGSLDLLADASRSHHPRNDDRAAACPRADRDSISEPPHQIPHRYARGNDDQLLFTADDPRGRK